MFSGGARGEMVKPLSHRDPVLIAIILRLKNAKAWDKTWYGLCERGMNRIWSCCDLQERHGRARGHAFFVYAQNKRRESVSSGERTKVGIRTWCNQQDRVEVLV